MLRRLLLPPVYYLVLTPWGLLRRLLRRDMVGRRDPGADSYLVLTQPSGRD